LKELEEASAAAGIEVLPLSPGLDVSATIRDRRARGQNLFIAGGGDGTVNHVVQGVVNTDATMAVIPLGTYNHFARDLEIPLDWREALEVATGTAVQQVDTARVNDRFFVNNVSLGLYPELVARREEHGRDYPRWKARLYAFAATIRKYPHVTLTIESAHHHETIRTHVFMVANNSYDLTTPGVEASRETLEEGRLAVYWLPHMPRITLMRHVGHYLAGKVRDTEGFRSFRTTRMKVQSPRATVRVGIDGELFTLETPIIVTSVPMSLSVKVPG
jgi:diacylglycerol kinase family enzyme